MKYELFIADFDGTLGIAPGVIEEGTVKAIKEYQSRGGRFCIVTGRSYKSIKSICEKHGIDGIVGAFQGANINVLKTDVKLFEGGLDYNLAKQVILRLKQDGITPSVWIDDCLYYEKIDGYVKMYLQDNGPFVKQVPDVAKTTQELKKMVNKVIVMEDEGRVNSHVEKYSKIFGDKLIVNSGASFLVEFIDPNHHKGFAVEFLAKHYGISLDKVIAVGDSLNDKELMNERWHCVAVGDGNNQLKKLAKEITVPFKENPVKYLLEKYCLN